MPRKPKSKSQQLVVFLLSSVDRTGTDQITCMILPSTDYTTFENNTSTFTFNCSGNGAELFWTVDGMGTASSYVLSRGISYTLYIISQDGVTVSSQLIVPTTKANNHTVVICRMLDTSSFNPDPVRLILQAWTGQSLQLHVQWTMNKKIEEVIEQLKTILEEDAKQVWKKEEQGLCHIFGSYHGEVDEVRQMATAYKVTWMLLVLHGSTDFRKFGGGDGQNEHIDKRNAGIWRSLAVELQGLRDKVLLPMDGDTPLHLAAEGGHTACVEHLLSTPGIDVNNVNMTRNFQHAFSYQLMSGVRDTNTSGGTKSSEGTNTSGGTKSSEGTNTSGGTTSSEGTNTSGGTKSSGGTNTSGGTMFPEGTNTSGGTKSPKRTNTSGGTKSSEGTNTSDGIKSPKRTNTSGGTKSSGHINSSGDDIRGEGGGGGLERRERGGVLMVNILRKSLLWTHNFKTGSFCYQLMILLMLLSNIGADAYVIISPSTDYTTFENNASTFTFNCSGNGTLLYWRVDGYTTGTLYVLNKEISYTPPVSPDGVTVSSQLIVPTTKANNNTVVVCTLLDASFNYHQSSDPVRLIIQGDVSATQSPSVPTAGNNSTHDYFNTTTTSTTAPNIINVIFAIEAAVVIIVIATCTAVVVLITVMVIRRTRASVVITSNNTPPRIQLDNLRRRDEQNYPRGPQLSAKWNRNVKIKENIVVDKYPMQST